MQAEVVIEPPPPNMRKTRHKKRRDPTRPRRAHLLPLRGPSGRETPMDDHFLRGDDIEDVATGNGVEMTGR